MGILKGFEKMGSNSLKPRQQRCIRLMATGCWTQRAIAEEIGVTQATICNWKKDPIFQAELQEALRVSVRDIAARALKEQEKLLEAKNEMVRFMAARDILDRAGVKPQDVAAVLPTPVVVISGAEQLQD